MLLRRQIEALTQYLAQLETPTHDDAENPFHDQATRRDHYIRERKDRRWDGEFKKQNMVSTSLEQLHKECVELCS